MQRNGNNGTAVPVPCGHCARPVGAVAILGADGTRYHPGCWEAAIVAADRASTLKADGRGQSLRATEISGKTGDR